MLPQRGMLTNGYRLQTGVHTPAAPPPQAAGTKAIDKTQVPIPGGYTAEKLIGRGGFGEVWKALAPGGFPAAVKIITRPADHEERIREQRALNVIKQLNHHFLIKTIATFSEEDKLYIVMDLADSSLRERLKVSKAQNLNGVPLEELLRYFREAAEALDYLHERDVLHRDIKPDNILLIGNHVRLADLGSALHQEQILASASNAGTPAYMAPEVYRGKTSKFSDQYSLAYTYAELRLGHRAFASTDYAGVMFDHLDNIPNLERLPENETKLLLKALAKKLDERYPTCLAFVEALEECASRQVPSLANRALPSMPKPREIPATQVGSNETGRRPDDASLVLKSEIKSATDPMPAATRREPTPRRRRRSVLPLIALPTEELTVIEKAQDTKARSPSCAARTLRASVLKAEKSNQGVKMSTPSRQPLSLDQRAVRLALAGCSALLVLFVCGIIYLSSASSTPPTQKQQTISNNDLMELRTENVNLKSQQTKNETALAILTAEFKAQPDARELKVLLNNLDGRVQTLKVNLEAMDRKCAELSSTSKNEFREEMKQVHGAIVARQNEIRAIHELIDSNVGKQDATVEKQDATQAALKVKLDAQADDIAKLRTAKADGDELYGAWSLELVEKREKRGDNIHREEDRVAGTTSFQFKNGLFRMERDKNDDGNGFGFYMLNSNKKELDIVRWVPSVDGQPAMLQTSKVMYELKGGDTLKIVFALGTDADYMAAFFKADSRVNTSEDHAIILHFKKVK